MLTEAIKEALLIKGIARSFGFEHQVVPIHYDSHNAICIVKNPMDHERNIHIDFKLYFIRLAIEDCK